MCWKEMRSRRWESFMVSSDNSPNILVLNHTKLKIAFFPFKLDQSKTVSCFCL